MDWHACSEAGNRATPGGGLSQVVQQLILRSHSRPVCMAYILVSYSHLFTFTHTHTHTPPLLFRSDYTVDVRSCHSHVVTFIYLLVMHKKDYTLII